MARWLRERLLFRSAKPAPPEPDYAPGPEQPDLLAAYRLQRERDFEDPYSGGGGTGDPLAPPGPSPRRRLVRVEVPEADPGDRPQEKMVALEDYADPFDTKEEAGAEQEKMKNEGYMEPYEAQKLLAEIQKRGSEDGSAVAKPLHLYDVPYEECESDTDADSEHPPEAPFRYSWLPEDDERPAEEYDQPWEWKKDRISRVFAGKGMAKGQPPSGGEKRNSLSWLNVEPGLKFGERVNPTLPLESQAWYHGTLSRVDAEGLLRLCREASYLVRNSESMHNAFSLSLKSSHGFLHMKLLPTEDNKFVLGQHSPPFDNVPEIIHHYSSHKLPIQGAEHMTLLYPVITRSSSCLAAEQ